MGLLHFPPDEWRGLLGSPLGRLPPQGPAAPMFVPPTEAGYGEPTPGDLWNTNPSPLAKRIGGIPESVATSLAEAHTRALAPEAADHGLSERQKLSPLQKALNPITSYPETYMRMNQDALNQISHGKDQITGPETDQTDYPATGSEFDTVAPHPLSNVAKGAGNVALGTFGYVSSPINAAYRTLFGQPLEDVTGFPRDYTEFAAQLATPGLGLPKILGKPGAVPPRPAPNGPLGIASSEAPVTRELPGTLPQPVSPAAEAASATSGGSGVIPAARTETSELKGPMPQLAKRYPKTVPPIWKIDGKTGKGYWAKDYSQEELDLQALRIAAQRDIDAGNFTPWFDPAERYYPDRTYYPPAMDTRNIRAVRASTQQKHEDIARSTEATQRLDEAFKRGRQQEENARDWAALGQLENEFIKEYGADEGRKNFKEFAESLAATTAGADPRANLMMAHYGNYLKAKGEDIPTEAYLYPYPVGSQFVAPNMKQYQKMIVEGHGVTPENPKRYDFANGFLGHVGGPRTSGTGHNGGPPLDDLGFDSGPPIDVQRYRLMDPERSAPPPGAYGHYKGAVVDRASANNVSPTYYGDMVYAGASENHRTKPMISEVNEAIERVHRVTGMPRGDVLRGLIRREIPLFGIGGILAGTQLPTDSDGN